MLSTTTARVGRSSRRYLIERVLQEKLIPPPRIYLAVFVLNRQHYLTCGLPADSSRENKGLY